MLFRLQRRNTFHSEEEEEDLKRFPGSVAKEESVLNTSPGANLALIRIKSHFSNSSSVKTAAAVAAKEIVIK
jgi:hypothetical protein